MVKPRKMTKEKLAELVERLQKELGGREEEFKMNGVEVKSLLDWTQKHGVECLLAKNGVSLSFHHTGIGTALTAKCACGQEMDISDYESW